MKARIFGAVAIVVLPVLGLTVGCAQPVAQDSPEIAARSQAWEDAFNAKDVDALVAFYSADALVLPSHAPMGRGSDVVRGVFDEMISAGLSGTLDTLEATAVGDLGVHTGTYTLSAGGVEVDRGKFMETWRKIDGEWRITADIFNSDLPAAPEGDTLMITHEVEEGERWLAAWRGEDSRHQLFASHGAPHVRTFQSVDDPNLTGLLVTVADMAALSALLDSPEGDEAKAADGVVDATIRVLAEVE